MTNKIRVNGFACGHRATRDFCHLPSENIFQAINACESVERLFALASEYFQGQGFGVICYIVPEAAAGPFVFMESGMPAAWMARYRNEGLVKHDPIPGMAFRLGHPVRLETLIKALPRLSDREQEYVDALESLVITDALLVPTYGPYGRPGLISLGRLAHPELLGQVDVPLAAAVAQAMHMRMEHLRVDEPLPSLSPREREILQWLVKGKSITDIATILHVKPPTIATHLQRIYAKMRVNDRISCVAKALARHYV